MEIDKDRPTILVALPSGMDQLPDRLKPMLFGIEEEQIPFQLETLPQASAVERAYQAATSSRLSVGIAFDEQHIIVHYKNLLPDQPLFDEPINSAEMIRRVGANAARLVKGVPFKL